MVPRRFLQAGIIALLAGTAFAGCSASTTASRATPTPTCPSAPAQQFKQALGTVTAVSSDQMSVKTTTSQVMVNFTTKTTFTRQATVSQSDLKDGQQVQVIVKDNGDGTYTAQRVAISTGVAQTGRFGSGNGGNRGFQNCRPTGTGTPTRRRGNGGGFPSGTPGTGPASGQRGVSGKIVTINGQTMTVAATNGGNYTITLDSSTTYEETVSAEASDIKVGQPVSVVGQAGANGSITATAIILLIALPTRQPTGQGQ
jgi:hypothetical protein